MVKYFSGFITLFCLVCVVNAQVPGTTIESAFQSFYGEPMKLVLGNKEVKIIVNSIEEDSAVIPLKMVFDLPLVEKVLLLKLKNTGYANNGYYNNECAGEPLFIAAYTLDPQKNISQLETRMRTYCGSDTITLLLWAKTKDGRYYSNSVTFKTTTESPG